MPIYREIVAGLIGQATVVDIDTGDNLQCSRVQYDGGDATELWFFEPVGSPADGELIGRTMDMNEVLPDPVIFRFQQSAAILSIMQELTIIYGNLVKAGK